MVSIYLAGSFKDQKKLRDLRDVLVAGGHRVTSRWLDQEHGGMSDAQVIAEPWRAREFAMQDIDDIARAEIVAVFTETPSTTGGKHFEHGLALGLSKKIVLVGDPENIFQTLEHHLITNAKDVSEFLGFIRCQ